MIYFKIQCNFLIKQWYKVKVIIICELIYNYINKIINLKLIPFWLNLLLKLFKILLKINFIIKIFYI